MTRYEKRGAVNVWWFPNQFSQSRYGEFQQSGQHSCTLISMLLADKISKIIDGLHNHPHELPPRAIDIFGNAINDGNSVYNRAIIIKPGEPRNLNLNIPDALKTLSSQARLHFHLHEWFFTHMPANVNDENYSHAAATRLAKILSGGLEFYLQPKFRSTSRYLFAALIADSRTVVFIFDVVVRIIAFFDSHQHGNKAGAVIAQASTDSIHEIALWYINMQMEVYGSKPPLYEISFLTTDGTQLPHPTNIDGMTA